MENGLFKILTVVGARPQIIKAAAISRAIKNYNLTVTGGSFYGEGSKSNSSDVDNGNGSDASSGSDESNGKTLKIVREYILHTGQHYDANMSAMFFNELDVPEPDFNLNVGSAPHGAQTSLMISGIEEVLLMVKPDAVILYGDTNSTLAGAVAASKMHIPVIHIEAGLRSFNKTMPEEINRIMCDHSSTLLFSPTVTGMENLAREGFNLKTKAPFTIDNPGVFHTGDIMYDNSLFFADKAGKIAPLGKIGGLGLKPDKYILVTIHRDNNTDDSMRLNNIFSALLDISKGEDIDNAVDIDNAMDIDTADGRIDTASIDSYEGNCLGDGIGVRGIDVVVPLHPRTAKILKQNLAPTLYKKIIASEHIKLTQPASFFEMISLEKGAQIVITDSGGVQKEAFFFRKPSLILRPQTEWVEIVECGAALLVDADYDSILAGYKVFTQADILTRSDKTSDKTSDKSSGGGGKFPSIFGDGHASEAILEILLNLQ